MKPSEKGTFGYDLHFLNRNKKTIVLKNNNDKCQLAVIPDYQGRVMTSTSNGLNGKSYGWINYDLISSKKFEEHINVFGGEDRFWLGPEGGQYSIFLKKGDEFTMENWSTPKSIDTEPFSLVENTDTFAIFNRDIQLTNYQEHEFNINVRRKVSLLDEEQIKKNLKLHFDDEMLFVGFQSENTMTNIGHSAWTKDNGLLSIWILGMFTPSENTTVIIPYKDSLELNTDYFGEIDSDRLKINEKTILFKGDGKYRCKIGVPFKNALPIFGSYDAKNNVLTLVEFSTTEVTSYVNSLWTYQDDPYAGDVINSYNDGPLETGEQLGPFYELESSSAAKELKQDDSIKHIHKTYHFEGEYESLNSIAKQTLNIDLNEIKF
jgi:hypothetical protein